MEYSKIVSVTALPGLYELINTKKDGVIIRSLDDKSTKFASSRIHNFSHLESIEVYTLRENVNLADVFQAMEKASDPLPDTRDNDGVRKYFEKIYPDIDFERVYNSDLKKMIKWYDVLKKNNIAIKLSKPEPEPEVNAAQDEIKPVKEKEEKELIKPGKSKKPAPPKSEKKEAPAPAGSKHTPVKKTGRKKEK